MGGTSKSDIKFGQNLMSSLESCIQVAEAKIKSPLSTSNWKEDKAKEYIVSYAHVSTPSEYYQWFCSTWQAFEVIYTDAYGKATDSDESHWVDLVGTVIPKVEILPDNISPKLRAMCVSFVLASLSSHPQAQTIALKYLILMSVELGLIKDAEFLKWLIKMMKQKIDETLVSKEQREDFVKALIEFFNKIEEYDHMTISVLCHVVLNTTFDNTIKKLCNNSETEEKINKAFAEISKKAVNSALNGEELFDFEIIKNTKRLYDSLDDQYRLILTIFVEGTIGTFEEFMNNNPTFIEDNKLNKDRMLLNIRMLTLISLIQDKDEVSLEEAEEATKLSGFNFKRLVISLNQTKNAVLKIVSDNEGNKIQKKYCQPRVVTEDEVSKLSTAIENSIKNLEGIMKKL